jgi:hypothetical protein
MKKTKHISNIFTIFAWAIKRHSALEKTAGIRYECLCAKI